MRFTTRLLVLPLLIGYPLRAQLDAQVQTVPTSVRWNRLVPGFVDEAAASRRAARKPRPPRATPPRCANSHKHRRRSSSFTHTTQRRTVRSGEFREKQPHCLFGRCSSQAPQPPCSPQFSRTHQFAHRLGGNWLEISRSQGLDREQLPAKVSERTSPIACSPGRRQSTSLHHGTAPFQRGRECGTALPAFLQLESLSRRRTDGCSTRRRSSVPRRLRRTVRPRGRRHSKKFDESLESGPPNKRRSRKNGITVTRGQPGTKPHPPQFAATTCRTPMPRACSLC